MPRPSPRPGQSPEHKLQPQDKGKHHKLIQFSLFHYFLFIACHFYVISHASVTVYLPFLL